MELGGHTILLTGGSSGIGFALAERFLKAGSAVVVTGRRENALAEARAQLPGLKTIVNDVGSAPERERLVQQLREQGIAIDVLINNAGIQNQADLTRLNDWDTISEEIRINLEGPMHLTSLALPLLRERARSFVVNVSSALAFVPLARVPIYSATKAALHSYSLSLRHTLRETNVRVIEIIPPAVYSNLGGSHQFGVPTAEYADSVMDGFSRDLDEITHQFSARAAQGTRQDLDQLFRSMNEVR